MQDHWSGLDESESVARRLERYIVNDEIANRIWHMIRAGESPVDALLMGIEGYVSALSAARAALLVAIKNQPVRVITNSKGYPETKQGETVRSMTP